MFDLNGAIAARRGELRRSGLGRATLDELESHLWEEMDRLRGEGIGEEEAFARAAAALGEAEALGEEFEKCRAAGGTMMEMQDDGTVALKRGGPGESLPTLAWMIVGAGGAVMAVSLLLFIINGYGIRGTGLGWALRTMGAFVLLYAALSVWGWRRGVRRMKARGQGGHLIAIAVALALVTSPVLFWSSVLGAYVGCEAAVRLTGTDTLERAADSPDGRWRAFVIDKPCLDGPDNRLMLEGRGAGQGSGGAREIAILIGDTDFNRAIAWSPGSETVVFINHYDLFALRPATMQAAVIPLRPSKARRDVFTAPAEACKVWFPKPGVVAYRYEGLEADGVIEEAAYRPWTAGEVVRPFNSPHLAPSADGERRMIVD